MSTPSIRPALSSDAEACLRIYAPFVTDSTITFEVEVPTVAAFAARIDRALASHTWLVAELDGRILGYAYAGPVKDRAAYRWSAEVSVYLSPDAHGRGLGRALYEALFSRLAARGFRRMIAVITLPNEASLGLHRALGFQLAGHLDAIGFKHGRWLDVAWMQADLPTPADQSGDRLAPPATS